MSDADILLSEVKCIQDFFNARTPEERGHVVERCSAFLQSLHMDKHCQFAIKKYIKKEPELALKYGAMQRFLRTANTRGIAAAIKEDRIVSVDPMSWLHRVDITTNISSADISTHTIMAAIDNLKTVPPKEISNKLEQHQETLLTNKALMILAQLSGEAKRQADYHEAGVLIGMLKFLANARNYGIYAACKYHTLEWKEHTPKKSKRARKKSKKARMIILILIILALGVAILYLTNPHLVHILLHF